MWRTFGIRVGSLIYWLLLIHIRSLSSLFFFLLRFVFLNVAPFTISPSDKWCSLATLVSWEVRFTPPGLFKILSPLSHYPGHTRNIHLTRKFALYPVSERAWETERVFVCSIRLLSRNHYHQANWLPVSFLAHLNLWWSLEYPFRMLSSRSDKVREQTK